MTSFEELKSAKALTCHREVNSDAGGATVHMVLLADGFLIDCGTGIYAERRAMILAQMINASDPSMLSRKALYS